MQRFQGNLVCMLKPVEETENSLKKYLLIWISVIFFENDDSAIFYSTGSLHLKETMSVLRVWLKNTF